MRSFAGPEVSGYKVSISEQRGATSMGTYGELEAVHVPEAFSDHPIFARKAD